MTTTLLRHLWQVIENTQPSALQQQADVPLIETLMGQLIDRQPLSEPERQQARTYLQSHLLLIRDLADARVHPFHSAAA